MCSKVRVRWQTRTVIHFPSKCFRKTHRTLVCIVKTAHVYSFQVNRSTATNLHSKGITLGTCNFPFYLPYWPLRKPVHKYYLCDRYPTATQHLPCFLSNECINISISKDASWVVTNLNYVVIWTRFFFPHWRSLMCTWAVCISYSLRHGLLMLTSQKLNLCCSPHAMATNDWIELVQGPYKWAEPIRFYVSGIWTGELRCSLLQWQELPGMPGGWRVWDRGGERHREKRRVRQSNLERWDHLSHGPWDTAGNPHAWLSRSQEDCLSFPPWGLWGSP